MAYNVSLLTDYTNEQNFPILKASILGSKTASLFTLQTGIKSSAALNLMDVDVVLQNDAVGSAVAGGGEVKFSQRQLAVAPIAVREFFDPKMLNSKYLQSQMKAGSADNELAFEAEIMDAVTFKVAAKMEKALWAGDVALTANSDLKHFNGYLKLIDAVGSGAIAITGATMTVANISTIVDTVYATIPVEILDAEDTAIFMGRDAFRMYTTALKNANLFHYGVDAGDEIVVPGTAIKIYALNGLNGSNRIVAGRKSNFFVGCDLEGEEDSASAVYIDAIEKVKLKIAFKYGAQIAFPKEVVTYK
ncbi:hypothetical protein ACNQGL_07645 [Flavobacterium sp. LB3P21]|uniref:hypothetical protein n=1 Tax=Flavobacterium sp. LB3P21 TaxID=3401719 RepID=UPI003AAE510F